MSEHKFLYRPHGSSYVDAMKLIREFTLEEFLKYLREDNPFPIQGSITIKSYCYDERNDWATWLVKDEAGVLGYINKPPYPEDHPMHSIISHEYIENH